MDTQIPIIKQSNSEIPCLPIVASSYGPPRLTYEQIMHNWAYTGYRIDIKTPFVGDVNIPLAAIRVTPLLPLFRFGAGGVDGKTPLDHPVMITPSSLEIPEDESIVCITSANPPPLSILAASHRGYTGGMEYRFRTVTSALTAGTIAFGIARSQKASILGVTHGGTRENPSTIFNRARSFFPSLTGLNTFCLENMAMIDLSSEKHCEISVPYHSNSSFVDLHQKIAYYNHYHTFDEKVMPISQLQTDDYIVLCTRGPITSGTEGTIISIDIDYRAQGDFEWIQSMPIAGGYIYANPYPLKTY